MASELLMQVQNSFSLTGLGVLLVAREPRPGLLQLDLHTVWAVTLELPDGSKLAATASVEEISRPHDAPDEGAAEPARALLLTHEGAATVPVGTLVYLPTGPETAQPALL